MTFIQVNYTIVSNAIAVFNESTSRMSTLFKLRLQHTVQKMKTNSCGTLHLLCEVGGVNYTVINANITMCKGMTCRSSHKQIFSSYSLGI